MTVISTTAVLDLGVICYIESTILDVRCAPSLSNSANDDTYMQLTDNPYDKYEETIMQLADQLTPILIGWRLKGIETPKPPMGISVAYCCLKGLVCDKCMEQIPDVLSLATKASVTALAALWTINGVDEELASTFTFIICMQVHREYRRLDPMYLTRSARAPSLMIAALKGTELADSFEINVRDYLIDLFEGNIERFEGKIDHDMTV